MWKAGAEQIPKLTVRVRFPSPAPAPPALNPAFTHADQAMLAEPKRVPVH